MSGGATEVQAGRYHTCARSGGDLYCWGHNGSGRLGDGTTTSRSRATLIDVLGDVEAITLGGSHTCTITRTTVLGMTLFPVYCWGSNTAGQLGIGSTTSQSTPALLRALSSQTIQVDAGEGHSCARISAGGVLCWGNNDFGQLGDGGTANRTTPTVIAGLTDVASIAAGDHHTCAVMTDGSLRCWGCNTDGQLGDGTNSHRGTPTRVVF
jgi:alpha-tubulin suppressor-like RCC1 family protein